MTDFTSFKGTAKRIEDVDLPRIGAEIAVGEDELHAFMDTEAAGSGFDRQGRPKILFEPHVFYRNLSGARRAAAVKAGLAYPKWGEKPYPKDSYPRLVKAMAIDETAALKSCSWSLTQILGENHAMVGYATVQAMVLDFMADEDNHLEAAVKFIVAAGIDDEMRALAKLTRPTKPEDCIGIVAVYNGPGFRKNGYHIKFAKAHNKWRGIKDTAYAPEPAVVPLPKARPAPATELDAELIKKVQGLLRDRGYPEVGEVDGKLGTRTRNAILAFQADNSLGLTGVVTDDLLSALVKAPQREIAPARANATAEDLKGAPSIDMAGTLKKVGMGGTIIGTGGALIEGLDIDGLIGGAAKFKSLADTVISISPWVLGAVAGIGAIWFGSRFIREQVEAYRQGRHV